MVLFALHEVRKSSTCVAIPNTNVWKSCASLEDRILKASGAQNKKKLKTLHHPDTQTKLSPNAKRSDAVPYPAVRLVLSPVEKRQQTEQQVNKPPKNNDGHKILMENRTKKERIAEKQNIEKNVEE